ncbi:hypothetical protein [Streptomyces sp. NPDC018045]|uniref:hypothetical protein n=1 Tax=Streptomyces sp. NPDC018045 TaxID=3365037 RepID=UPI0037944947
MSRASTVLVGPAPVAKGPGAVFAFIMTVLVLTCGLLLIVLTDQWLAWVRWALEAVGVLTVFGLACSLVFRWVTRPG